MAGDVNAFFHPGVGAHSVFILGSLCVCAEGAEIEVMIAEVCCSLFCIFSCFVYCLQERSRRKGLALEALQVLYSPLLCVVLC